MKLWIREDKSRKGAVKNTQGQRERERGREGERGRGHYSGSSKTITAGQLKLQNVTAEDAEK
jgi:hypothetical protein